MRTGIGRNATLPPRQLKHSRSARIIFHSFVARRATEATATMRTSGAERPASSAFRSASS
eukprot:scaffold3504_cov240-Pinguiococcus_pyrenoidosus.AAC.15